MMMSKVNLSIRIEAALRARLGYAGEKMGLSVPDAARLAFSQFVGEWEKQNKPIPSTEVEQRVKAIVDKNPSMRKKGRQSK